MNTTRFTRTRITELCPWYPVPGDQAIGDGALGFWVVDPDNDTSNGLVIDGVLVSYAELASVQDREGALDSGVTPELLAIWIRQGGRSYPQLVDWLYQHACECQGYYT